jgi:hypothetical protein
MPRYFELRAPGTKLSSIGAADSLAGSLNDSAADLGVRIVAVKRSRPGAFIYAYSSRSRQTRNAIVDRLRNDRRFADCGFSDERTTADGPFAK